MVIKEQITITKSKLLVELLYSCMHHSSLPVNFSVYYTTQRRITLRDSPIIFFLPLMLHPLCSTGEFTACASLCSILPDTVFRPVLWLLTAQSLQPSVFYCTHWTLVYFRPPCCTLLYSVNPIVLYCTPTHPEVLYYNVCTLVYSTILAVTVCIPTSDT